MNFFKIISFVFVSSFVCLSQGFAAAYSNQDLQPLMISHKYLEYIWNECSQIPEDELRKVSVLKYRKGGQDQRMDYWYRYLYKGSHLPTVIFLPGGPGGNSMSYYVGALERIIEASKANVIFIDPRGVDCNFVDPAKFPPETISTEEAAKDIIQVIKKERLENYYIYGHSYGTILATVLADLLNFESDTVAPRKVILEGVVGEAVSTVGDGYWVNFADVMNEVIQKDIYLSYLVQNIDSFPVSYPPEFWAHILLDVINFSGEDEVDADKLQIEQLAQDFYKGKDLSTASKSFLLENFKDFISYESNNSPNDKQHFYALYVQYAVWCSEISSFPPDFYTLTIRSGRLESVVKEGALNNCIPYKPNERLYDPQDYKIKVPVIYFQGSFDPNTPIKGAYYHYGSQIHSREKVFVEVQGSGHEPSMEKLSSCTVSLWDEIFKTNTDFSNILDQKGHCK